MPKKKLSHSRDGVHAIVKDVTETSMEGDNLLEKRLNAYLTRRFVLSGGVPADECLSEARAIIAMVRTYDRDGL